MFAVLGLYVGMTLASDRGFQRHVIPRKRRRLAQATKAQSLTGPSASPARDLELAIADFTAIFGLGWGPVTRRKHSDDFRRFLGWLDATGTPATIDALDVAVLARYVQYLRAKPKVYGVWKGAPDALERTLARGPVRTLSANSINAYVRPLRSLALWLVDEGRLTRNPFRMARRHGVGRSLLPFEDTPTKSATMEDLGALELGCAGDGPADFRDRAIVSVLTTTAARNSSVRLLAIGDVDFERGVIVFRRAKGGKTIEVALHPRTRQAIRDYLDVARPTLLSSATDGAPSPSEPLFVSEFDRTAARPLSMNALSGMLTRRYHRGGGTLAYFGSHRIRHATATLLVNHGMPLEEVSRYLGHSSTAPTRRYAQHTTQSLGDRAAEALAKAGLT